MRKVRMNRIFWVVLLSLGLAMGVANADIEEGLVAHWTFDEGQGTTAEDSSGNDNHGTVQGDPQWVEGWAGGALQFDGVDDYVSAPHIPLDSRSFTIAMWVNPVLYTDQQIIFSQRQTSATDTDMHFRLGGPGGTAPNPGAVRMGFYSNDLDTGGGIIEDNNWYHITFWYDFENQDRRIYVDGDQRAQGASTPYLGTSGDTVIGSWAGASQWFRGIIDDVRVYHRALTDDDIVELYEWTGVMAKILVNGAAVKDNWCYGGDEITLDASVWPESTDWNWVQISPDDPVVIDPDPGTAIRTFTAPSLAVGMPFTFRVTVTAEGETETADFVVNVRSAGAPQVAAGNVRILPMNKGLTVLWDEVYDATVYDVDLEITPGFWFTYGTDLEGPPFSISNQPLGKEYGVKVRAKNAKGSGAESDPQYYTVMPNLALPAPGGSYPPSASFDYDGNPVPGMSDGAHDDSHDSSGTAADTEDLWGYSWPNPLYFDRIVYVAGGIVYNGGWFTDLKVQYTEDGSEWKDVPYSITPPYDFTDSPAGRHDFVRYDITFPVVRGTGVRLYGVPGGVDTFTSIAEFEVYGDQTRAADFIAAQGVDAEFSERTTATLDGSCSLSAAGDIVSYTWTAPAGFPYTLVEVPGTNGAKMTFEAAGVDADEAYVFSLTVEDSEGNTDTDDDVQITIKNLVTTAVAGADRKVAEGDEVILSGQGSLTTSGDITYHWECVSHPDFQLADPDNAVCTFTAPVIWSYKMEMTFRLTVDDLLGLPDSVSTDEVVIEVRNFLTVSVLSEDFEDGVADGFTVFAGTWDVVDGWYVQSDTTGGLIARSWVDTGVVDQYTIELDCIQMGGETKVIFAQPDVDENYRLDLWPNRARVSMGGTTDDMQNLALFSTGQVFHVKVEVSLDGIKTYVNGEALHDTPWAGSGTPDGKIAVGSYDNSSRFDNLIVSGPPSQLADAYAVRELPASYQPDTTLEVKLSVRANPDNLPTSIQVRETIPAGTDVADLGGGTRIGNEIAWTLTGDDVGIATRSYTLTVLSGTTGAMNFTGNVSYTGVSEQEVFGDNVVYEVPSAPRNVGVEMLIAGHVSWSVNPEEGIAGYRIYRSVDGGDWEDMGLVSGTSYLDKWLYLAPDSTYSYKVVAVNVAGAEGDASDPTYPATLKMLIRQAEDFNYGGGLYPWDDTVAIAAVEATAADDLDGTDYWHPNTGGPDPRVYRPLDNRADGTGVGIEITEEVDKPGEYHTNIGWIDAGSWYRYTFDVPSPGAGDPEGGWVKFSLRVASPGGGTIAAYWDEQLVGTVSYITGNYHIFTDAAMEEQVQANPGPHILRVVSESGELNLDMVGVGFNWTPPKRKVLFEEDFEDWTNLYDDVDAINEGWTLEYGPSGKTDGSWRLWNTGGDLLRETDPDIGAMTSNYMISDGDMAGDYEMNEGLITPDIDATEHTKLRLDFSKNYRIYLEDTGRQQIAEVDIRTKDPVTQMYSGWTNLLHWDLQDAVEYNTDPEVLDISAFDNNIIQIRWHYYDAQFDYWFAIDDIVVSGEKEEIIVPPAVRAIGITDGTLDLSWSAFADTYYVECTDDLVSGDWSHVAGPITDTSWSGDVSAVCPGDVAYVRIRGE